MPGTFGDELRHWRTERGLSQIELGSIAGVSQRHVSFLETGRSMPSRGMVLRIGRALGIPLREQNVMLAAADFPPAFTVTPLDDLLGARHALDAMLDAHEPNIALVIDGRWDIVAANAPFGRFMDLLFPDPHRPIGGRRNLVRLVCAPDGLRAHMTTWERTAAPMVARLLRDASEHPDDEGLQAIVDEILDYPGVRDLADPGPPDHHDPVVTARYLVGDADVAFFTTVTTVQGAHDVTLAELRLETYWPADDVSAGVWEAIMGVGGA